MKNNKDWKRNFRKIRRTKIFKAAVGACVVVVIGTTAFFVVHTKAQTQQVMTISVQNATAEEGTISSTVTGTGSLATADTVSVTVPTGVKIESVSVSAGDTVTAGQVLATVTQASVAGQMVSVQDNIDSIDDELDSDDLTDLQIQNLNGQRADLAATLATLTELYNTCQITASADGVIGNVNVTEGNETSSGSSSSSSTTSSTTATQMSTASTKTGTNANSTVQLLSLSTSTNITGNTSGNTTENTDEDTTKELTVVSDYSKLTITAPKTGETPQQEIEETDCYAGKIVWDTTDETYKADTAYTAILALTAKTGYTFHESTLPQITCESYEYEIVDQGVEGNTLFMKLVFAKTESVQQDTPTSTPTPTPDSTDNSGSSTNQGTATQPSNGNSAYSGSGSDSSQGDNSAMTSSLSSSFSSGSMTASSGSTSGTTAVSSSTTGSTTSGSSTSSYSGSEITAFTIQTQDNVKLSVSVDELDILSVKKGQTATVTLDAIDGQTFEGTITSTATSATTSNGSAKYAVEITIPKDENMLVGMSATATITVEEAENAVLIPVSALQEKGDTTFVYTQEDEQGNLSGEVEVETGLSNGSQVEITSGLSTGDTVYYTKAEADSSSDSFTKGDFGGQMGGGSMPSGDMPSGEMPSGGSQGGMGRMSGTN